MPHPLSNAPEGFPDVSPGGFPLHYALMPDPSDTNWPRRSIPVPGMAPRLYHAGVTFANDAEVHAYIARVMEPSPVVGGVPWHQVKYNGPLQPSQLFENVSSFYLAKRAAQRTISGRGGDLFEMVTNGGNYMVALIKQWALNNMPPDFDVEAYNGPNKAEIDAVNAA